MTATAPRGDRRGVALVLRLAVVAVLAVVVAVLGVRLHTAARTDAAPTTDEVGADARSAATTAVPLVLSYDWRHLDADRGEAARFGTGAFAAQYQQTFDSTIASPARTQHLVQNATVSRSAVIAASDASVDVMVLVVFRARRETTNQETNAPGLLRVHMVPLDGGWRIAELRSV